MTKKTSLTLSQIVLGVVALRLAAIVIAALILRALPEHAHDMSAIMVTASSSAHANDPLRDLRSRD